MASLSDLLHSWPCGDGARCFVSLLALRAWEQHGLCFDERETRRKRALLRGSFQLFCQRQRTEVRLTEQQRHRPVEPNKP
eukprot:2154982-Rhodomonas_salina.1